jgi:hypothetical protein
MSPSTTGKWVSRAAATGGGRTYRGQVPVNWYAALVVLVILGLVSIVFSRYEYEHPHSAKVQPAVGTTLFAGYSIEVCGKVLAPLAASVNSTTAGVTTPGLGVLNVSPHTAAQAGDNATLGAFFTDYPGASLSSTQLKVPGHGTYRNGQVCAKGTPDAGQKGFVKAEVWPNAVSTTGTVLTSNPADHKIEARTLITVGFVPTNAPLHRPPQSTINNVLGFSGTVVNGTTTTTTTPTSTTTTPTSTTTTTAPTSTTTTG